MTFSNTPQYAQLLADQWALRQPQRDREAVEHRVREQEADHDA